MRTFGFVCFIALLTTGCTRYQPKPLEERKILEDLRALTLESAAVSSSSSDSEAFDPSDGLSEDEAVSLALSLNPGLGAQRAAKGVAEAQLLAAGLYPDPELDARWISRGDGTVLEGSLLQALSLTGERGLRRQRARLRIEEVNLELASVEWKLVQEVRHAFADLLVSEEAVRIAQADLELRLKVASLIQTRQELGAATLLETHLSALDAVQQRRVVLSEGIRRDLARQELNRLIGVGPGTPYPLQVAGDPWAILKLPGPERLEELALIRRPDLAAARMAYEQSEKGLQLATRGQYPRLRIGPTYGEEEGESGLGIAASVEIPMWNRNRGEIAEKLAERARLAEEFRARIAALRAALASALSELERQEGLLRLVEEEVRPRLERSLSLVEESLQAGKIEPTALLLLQDRLLEAKRDALEVRSAYRKALIKLEEVAGVRASEMEEMEKPVGKE